MDQSTREAIAAFLPLIVFGGIFLWFLLRSKSASKFQQDCLAEMKLQTAQQTEIARNLDRIAAAIERGRA